MTTGDHSLAARLSRAARWPLRQEQPLAPPRKALIMQPCCLGRVMLTTPLLAALSEAFPEARFDWAISDWALPAIGSNPRITRTIRSGPGDLAQNSSEQTHALLETMRAEGYDTCFIPSRSSEAARLAQKAGIAQRVGLNGRDSASGTAGEGTAAQYLSLAAAVGVDEAILRAAEMEFTPTDMDRTAVTRWLVEEFDWLGDVPLVVLHPGGGDNPAQTNHAKRWPTQRFARLANHLTRVHGARVIVVGTAEERPLANQVVGMMSAAAVNRAGLMGLGQLGALSELASLYVGNDAGSTYVAVATGCPTLVIYGPNTPTLDVAPAARGRVQTLWQPYEGAFDWANGVSVEQAVAAADELLAAHSATTGTPLENTLT